MEAAVAQAMEEGALGLSSALIYVPDLFARTEELVALARVAARYGGSYITHQRDEGDDGATGLDASMDEVFRIAREAGIPAEIYHLKARAARQLGPHAGDAAAADRDGAGRGPRRERRPVSVDGQLERPRREPARLGARGRGGRAWWRGSPTPPRRARARADFLKMKENADWPAGATRILVTSVLDPETQEVRGPDPRRDREASEGKDPVDVLLDVVVTDRGEHRSGDLRDERGRRARGATPSLRVVLHRLRRRGPRTAFSRGRRRTRAPSARRHGSSATTCGTRRSWDSRRPSAR